MTTRLILKAAFDDLQKTPIHFECVEISNFLLPAEMINCYRIESGGGHDFQSRGFAMAKVKIKVTRENKGSVSRSFVLIDNRILPFKDGHDINILVEAGTKHGITVVCIGDIHASTTAKVTRASGNVIDPLEVTIDPEDNGIDHSSDEFEVKAV